MKYSEYSQWKLEAFNEATLSAQTISPISMTKIELHPVSQAVEIFETFISLDMAMLSEEEDAKFFKNVCRAKL